MKWIRLSSFSVIRLIIIFIAPAILFAQNDTTGLVRYHPEFKFQDGLYANFQQVRLNQPIPKSRIITALDYNDDQFFNRLLEQKKIAYYDDLGSKNEVDVGQIWGFSRNGNIYVRVGGEFDRITVIGRICHFVANITTYNQRYYSPSIYDHYYYPYGGYYPQSNYEAKEMRQFLLDFDTGEIMNYDTKSVEVLLMRDPELHEEYMNLRNKKRKQLKFVYIRKFNERNPLYLPPGNN